MTANCNTVSLEREITVLQPPNKSMYWLNHAEVLVLTADTPTKGRRQVHHAEFLMLTADTQDRLL